MSNQTRIKGKQIFNFLAVRRRPFISAIISVRTIKYKIFPEYAFAGCGRAAASAPPPLQLSKVFTKLINVYLNLLYTHISRRMWHKHTVFACIHIHTYIGSNIKFQI